MKEERERSTILESGNFGGNMPGFFVPSGHPPGTTFHSASGSGRHIPDNGFPMQVLESKKKIVIRANIQNLSRDHLEIFITSKEVIIWSYFQSPVKQGNSGKDTEWRVIYRKYPLSTAVDPASSRASFWEGLLRIEMAKCDLAVTEGQRKLPIMEGRPRDVLRGP